MDFYLASVSPALVLFSFDFPLEAIEDILYRLGWHFLSGGQPTDEYVWTQVRYFENLVKSGKVARKENVK